MAAASRILLEHRRRCAVHCAFLTDGTGLGTAAQRRDAESAAVLGSLGVRRDAIHFLGSRLPIPDGTLVERLDAALAALEEAVRDVNIVRVYCLAWEGGHQDHDASQLVAAAFARRRGVLDHCREMPLYRASRVSGGRFFRVFSPLHPQRWETRRISIADGLRLALLPRHYRSQRSSWLGLFPEAFVRTAILRRERMRRVDVSRHRTRPHAGLLFYERRFRFPYERFAAAAAPFIDAHLQF